MLWAGGVSGRTGGEYGMECGMERWILAAMTCSRILFLSICPIHSFLTPQIYANSRSDMGPRRHIGYRVANLEEASWFHPPLEAPWLSFIGAIGWGYDWGMTLLAGCGENDCYHCLFEWRRLGLSDRNRDRKIIPLTIFQKREFCHLLKFPLLDNG